MSGSNSGQRTQGVQQPSIQTNTNIKSVSDQVQGHSSVNNVNSGGAPSSSTAAHSNAIKSGGNALTTSSSNNIQRMQGVQQSSIQTDTDITSISDQVEGNSSVSHVSSGGTSSPSTAAHSSAPTTSDANSVLRAQGVQYSTVQTDADITSIVDQTQENTTVRNVPSSANLGSNQINTANQSGSSQTVNGSYSIHTGQSVVQTAIEVITQNEVINRVTSINEKQRDTTPVKRRPSTYPIPSNSRVDKNAYYFTRNK
ncbi:hypothetical protein BACPU_23420 [Bacillus pumilus]|nr:hypothetical protein BACPU_23420 [Bacillus pumilus]